jgi:hypothetical protein
VSQSAAPGRDEADAELVAGHLRPHALGMFTVTEKDAAAIRAAFDQEAEFVGCHRVASPVPKGHRCLRRRAVLDAKKRPNCLLTNAGELVEKRIRPTGEAGIQPMLFELQQNVRDLKYLNKTKAFLSGFYFLCAHNSQGYLLVIKWYIALYFFMLILTPDYVMCSFDILTPFFGSCFGQPLPRLFLAK